MKQQLQWLAPPSFRGRRVHLPPNGSLSNPVLLRFASDTFMNELLETLEHDPSQLNEFVAKAETWRTATEADSPSVKKQAAPSSPMVRTLQRLGISTGSIKEKANNPSLKFQGTSSTSPPNTPIKFYQPAHKRYYLVTASLVCQEFGLPDRWLNPSQQERATFVIRRLLPPPNSNPNVDKLTSDLSTWQEYAFIERPNGNLWQKVNKNNGNLNETLIPGEEQLPLFTLGYTEQSGRKRQIFSGFIPVGKREAYMGAGEQTTLAQSETQPTVSETGVRSDDTPIDPRVYLFHTQVAGPWKTLIEIALETSETLNGVGEPGEPFGSPPGDDETQDDLLSTARDQIQTGSWYILLDLYSFLNTYLPNVWTVIEGSQSISSIHRTAELNLIDRLESIVSEVANYLIFSDTFLEHSAYVNKSPYSELNEADRKPRFFSLTDALLSIRKDKELLENISRSYERTNATSINEWPSLFFPFVDPEEFQPKDLKLEGFDNPNFGLSPEEITTRKTSIVDELVRLIGLALPTIPEDLTPNKRLNMLPVLDTREGCFVIRCVLERPVCGPLHPPLISQPTQAFQMAGFFDPDAPARPIRIALPIDTSPAGLRKFDKNTAFMMSDMLCGQIDRLKKLSFGSLVRSVLPWPFRKKLSVGADKGPCTQDDGASIGMMCSLSIPIVTICALVLVIMIASLLNKIFRWMPYFITSFPLPGFKAKE